jgi:manganese oxidase
MNGIVIGIDIAGATTAPRAWRPAKRLRLFVQSDSTARDSVRRFGYVLQRDAEPSPDSIESPGPLLLLTRGEPTSIRVVNRSTEPTAVHWHGIELESYYDGAVGWSSDGKRTAPAIRPDSSFEVRITPKRAGTFMYHTHFNEMRQQYGGLVGPLIVLEPGERWDPKRDLLFLISESNRGALLVNGTAAPPAKDLRVGTKYRIRVADITGFRQILLARVMRDTSLATWRPIARDGFTLPAHQTLARPSVATVSSGETADFELVPSAPGALRLELVARSRAGVETVQGTVLLRVSAAE